MIDDVIYVFAARYAHGRNTGSALMVVRSILSEWDFISLHTKKQLYKESFEAQSCKEDWKLLQDRFEADDKLKDGLNG